jgi:hypothetical protein
VKCPFCIEEDEKSRVYPSAWANRTLAYHPPYYDEEGHKHVHDSNVTSRQFKCSRGHVWEERISGSCPSCDWEGRGKEVRRLDGEWISGTETAETKPSTAGSAITKGERDG